MFMFEDEPGERVTFENGKGQKIAGWLHKANKKPQLVMLAHGHPAWCHSKHLEYAEAFRAAGLNALRFDFAGSGASEGDFGEQTVVTAADDLHSAVGWAQSEGYVDLSLMGASFGATVVLMVALHHPEIERIVLRSPAPDLTDETEVNMFSSLAQWEKDGFYEQPNRSDPNKPFRIPYQFHLDAQEHVMYEPAKKIQAKTLVLAGSADTLVPFEQMQRLAENLPHALLIILEGADHTLTIGDSREEANRLMVDWFID